MARFSDEWLRELLSKNDIVSVIGQYVPLERKGSRYWGFCPFHKETNASFNINPDKQMFYCFSCQRGGSVINFIMEYNHLSYIEAVNFLADRVGMPMPQMVDNRAYEAKKKERNRLYEVNKAAATYFHKNLLSAKGKSARDYLQNRGISGSVITRFGLGYASNSFDELLHYLKDKGFHSSDIVKAGLAKMKDGKVYDVFRNRVMFPIINVFDKVIGFGGRVMDKDGIPKYLNTTNTPIYDKRHNLYGFNNIKKMRGLKSIIVVEGYMDVIALNAFGIRPVAASLGTALTTEQARLIKRYVNQVYIAYDGDSAGQKATLRGLDILEGQGLEVKVIGFREGKDPDEFIRAYGPAEFKRAVKEALPLVDYKLTSLKKEYDFDDPNEVMKYCKEASKILKGIKSSIARDYYIGKLSDMTGISRQSIEAELQDEEGAPKNQQLNNLSSNGNKLDKMEDFIYERKMIQLLLDKPDYIFGLTEQIDENDFRNDLFKKIFLCMKNAIKEGILPSHAEILSKLSDHEDFGRLVNMLNEKRSLEDIESGEEYIKGLIRSIRLRNLEAKKEALQNELIKTGGGKQPRDILKEIETVNKLIYKFKSEMK